MESSTFASTDVREVHQSLMGSLPTCTVSPSHTKANLRIRLHTFRQFAEQQLHTFEAHMKDHPTKYVKRKLAAHEDDNLTQECQRFLEKIKCKFTERWTKIKSHAPGRDVSKVRRYVDLGFHGVGYRAYINDVDSTRFTIVPRTFNGRFDIAVRVRVVYAKTPRRPEHIQVLYDGWQCIPYVSERVDDGDGDHDTWSKFFVKNYSPKGGVFTIKIGQAVYTTTPEDLVVCRRNRFPLYERYFGRTSVLEKRNNRRRLVVQVCPLPLRIVDFPHMVNAYLNAPLYSPAKALQENMAFTATRSDTKHTTSKKLVLPNRKRAKRTRILVQVKQ